MFQHTLPQTQTETIVEPGVVVGMVDIDPMDQRVASRQAWVTPHPVYGSSAAYDGSDDLDAMDVYFAGR